MPPKIELAQAKGFSLFMLKAILSSRGDAEVSIGIAIALVITAIWPEKSSSAPAP